MAKPPIRKNQRIDFDKIKPQTPLNFGVRSNGEFFRAPNEKEKLIEKLTLERAEAHAEKLGMDRRSFLASAAGMATTLAVINSVNGCANDDDDDASNFQCDPEGAGEILSGDEFVMDVQSHHIDNELEWRDPGYGAWTETNKLYYTFFCFAFQGSATGGECAAATPDAFPSWFDPNVGIESLPLPDVCKETANHVPCLGLEDYMDLMFRQSDTSVAVLSTFPAMTCEQADRFGYNLDQGICGDFLPTASIAHSRDVVNERAGSKRVLSHAAVFPNAPTWLNSGEKTRWVDEQLRAMEFAVAEHKIDAWKCYTPFGALPLETVEGKTFEDLVLPIVMSQITGQGWFLDDDFGLEMIKKAIDLKRPIINVHKGFALPTFDTVHTSARDIGVVAADFPEAIFVVYHSALNHGASGVSGITGGDIEEGPYDPSLPEEEQVGVNSLIHSLAINGIDASNNANVYAELGGPGARAISDPIQGTHIFGKLLKQVGEDYILWGTDAIWGGSPQGLIEGFRNFRMDPATQEANGYPDLTNEIKAKILGLNAARLYDVDVSAARCTIDSFTGARNEFKQARLVKPQPLHPLQVHQGPRTRREFFQLWQTKNFLPG